MADAMIDGGIIHVAWIVMLILLGALLGPVLNAVIVRVPLGLRGLGGMPRCASCSERVAWRDAVPIISYVVQHGRCRHCHARVSARCLLVEVLTAAGFGLVAWGSVGGVFPSLLMPLLLYWVAVAVVLAVVDFEHHRLPNTIVLPAYIVTGVLLTVASVVTGEFGRLIAAAMGVVVLGGFYLVLAAARRGGMGFGDVKLAGALGMLLAWLGWAQFAVGALAGFVLGGFFGIVLILGGQATGKTALPFGPFMLLGAACGIALGQPLTDASFAVGGAAWPAEQSACISWLA